MFRLTLVAVLLVVVSVSGFAQRHSGDSEHERYTKPSNPILNIEDQLTRTWSYPRLSELMKMRVMTVDVYDPKTNLNDSYDGVALNVLLPDSSVRRVDVFEDGRLFHDRLAISSADLDLHSPVIVAYNKNGKTLGQHSFCLIAKSRNDNWVVISKLAYIRLDNTP